MKSEDVTRQFVAAINGHDAEAIVALMTADHRFTDSGGLVVKGREQMAQGWQMYFRMFPDYAIEVTEIVAAGNLVALFGSASGTYTVDGHLKEANRWACPAAWRALIAGDRVAEWQVFADLAPVEAIVRREREAADVRAIERLVQDAVSATQRADAAALGAMFTEDAVQMPPNSLVKIGRQEIQAGFKAFFDNYKASGSAELVEVVVAGDWAFARGASDWKATPRHGGEPVGDNEIWLDTYRRQRDGSWKVHRSIWNSGRRATQD